MPQPVVINFLLVSNISRLMLSVTSFASPSSSMDRVKSVFLYPYSSGVEKERLEHRGASPPLRVPPDTEAGSEQFIAATAIFDGRKK